MAHTPTHSRWFPVLLTVQIEPMSQFRLEQTARMIFVAATSSEAEPAIVRVIVSSAFWMLSPRMRSAIAALRKRPVTMRMPRKTWSGMSRLPIGSSANGPRP
jgi:hypothetical protein